MSNNVECTCVIPGCSHYGKKEYAQLDFVRGHIRRKHSFEDLKQIALQNGLISSVNGFVNFEWLVNEIAKICVRNVN